MRLSTAASLCLLAAPLAPAAAHAQLFHRGQPSLPQCNGFATLDAFLDSTTTGYAMMDSLRRAQVRVIASTSLGHIDHLPTTRPVVEIAPQGTQPRFKIATSSGDDDLDSLAMVAAADLDTAMLLPAQPLRISWGARAGDDPYAHWRVCTIDQPNGDDPVMQLYNDRARGLTGTVIARWVVDTAGGVTPNSLTIVKSSIPMLEDVVRVGLPKTHFAKTWVESRDGSVKVAVPVASLRVFTFEQN